MNESIKTLSFVSAAAIISLLAVGSHFLNRPTNSADFELVGQPFYSEFESASQAQSLEVAAVDSESGVLKRFSIENQQGLWRIPSHYDYPAEAAARLATTASSVMGITRDSLAGRLAKEHERLGVIDPLGEEIDDPESVGKRITMKDAEGETVVDFIVGKEAGEVVLSDTERPFGTSGDANYYYVRRPDEQQTYKVKLDIDLSTKFSDWIDPDLLHLEQNEVTDVLIDNYALEEDRSNPLAQSPALFKSQGDKIEIARKSNTDAWELAGLNPETEELKTSRINEILGVLDQMKIAGVRPKYKYKDHLLLTADLKLNQQPEFKDNPQEFARAINRLQNELDQKGFNLAGSAEKMELVAQKGDLRIGTEKGVVYTLHVGKAFDGDEEAIEIGSSEGQADTQSDAPNDSSKSKTDTESELSSNDNPDKSTDEKTDPIEDAKNRYLMVRVSFNQDLIFPKPLNPIEPVAPVEPEGYQPPPEEPPVESQAVAEPVDDDAPQPPPSDDKPDRNPEFVKYDEALKTYQEQMLEYELGKTRFQNETEEFEKKVKAGQELVDELNERFGDWYYVITGNNLSTLQTSRADLVTQKEIPISATDEVMPPRPDIAFPSLPTEDAVKREPPLPQTAVEQEAEMKAKAAAEKEAAEKETGEKAAGDDAGGETERAEKPVEKNDSPDKPASKKDN